MSDVEAPSRPKLQGAEPQILVADISAACAFYTQKLGFDVAFVYGDPPFYAQVFRDGARLNLRHAAQPILDAQTRAQEQFLSATITLADAAPLYREYQAANVPLTQPLKTEPWGAQTFMVRDLDGNLLLFAGAVDG
jgi:catechol 2,3-dioxygenase-like lactoylglutathione lyase family enzyme